MKDMQDERLAQLTKDLSFLRTAISKNSSILREIGYSYSLRHTAITGGLVTIVVSLGYFFAFERYETYAAFPEWLKWLLGGSVVFSLIIVSVIKIVSIARSAKRTNELYTFGYLMNALFKGSVAHITIPAILLVIFGSIALAMQGDTQRIVPIILIGMGFSLNSTGSVFLLPEVLFMGYWLMLHGVLAFLFPQISPALWVCFSFGLGWLAFGIVVIIIHKRRVQKE